ncbi:MAG: hypothetical protein VBE63_20305 [Lamprobacter sp.]|uniref:hypothetical protein n=1 Tax=Lamprobacter sp. TaxID=3100796 RepID=UPI002B259EE7|nr:hypothetical protein [Lamprobacter sp.]MEA3642261.1 hypothetical protein [Lamprobacter sp.]
MKQSRLTGLTLIDILILITIVAIVAALGGPALINCLNQTGLVPSSTEDANSACAFSTLSSSE